jgi:hypothetical protein
MDVTVRSDPHAFLDIPFPSALFSTFSTFGAIRQNAGSPLIGALPFAVFDLFAHDPPQAGECGPGRGYRFLLVKEA